MEYGLPKFVKDTNGFTHWCNQLLNALRRKTLHSSSDILVNETANGTTLTLAKKINPPSVVAKPGSPGLTGLIPRGLYIDGNNYSTNEMVIIQSGVAAGTYYSTIDNNINNPITGIGWLQISDGNLVGNWF
jgi:hypothetical protein